MSKENQTAAQGLSDGLLTTGNFTIQASMPNGKTITVSGYIYAHTDFAAISKQVDLLHDVVDRQRRKAEIPELEIKLDHKVRQLAQVRDVLVDMESKKKGGKPLSSAEKTQFNGLETNIKVLLKEIDEGEKAVAERKAEFPS